MASQEREDVTHYLTGPAYGVGLLFILLPIVDVVSQVWPPSLGSPSWRYGLVGLGANYLISVVFGFLLVCLAAGSQWHRRALRILAIVCSALAVLSVLAVLAFVLDVFQLRPGIPRDNSAALRMFDIGAAKAVFKYLLTAVAFAWVALGALRAGREIPAPVEEEAPKLVGQKG